MINYMIAALIISNLALWASLWYRFRTNDRKALQAHYELKGEISVLGKNLNGKIQEVRDGTPRLTINEQNEAVLYTRKGQEIHNFKLGKK